MMKKNRAEELFRKIEPPEVVDETVELDRSVMTVEEVDKLVKESAVRIGKPSCDFCDTVATAISGPYLLCLDCLNNRKDYTSPLRDGLKEARDRGEIPLKATSTDQVGQTNQ